MISAMFIATIITVFTQVLVIPVPTLHRGIDYAIDRAPIAYISCCDRPLAWKRTDIYIYKMGQKCEAIMRTSKVFFHLKDSLVNLQ